jgi:hypothetical protein
MHNQERMDLLMAIYNAIFHSKAQNSDITKVGMNHPKLLMYDWTNKTWITGSVHGRWFKNGQLRGFDVGFNLGDRILDIRCIEQNPLTGSEPARMAQKGSKIMWVIQRDKNVWLGRIQDGQWIPARERAYQPVQHTAAASQTGPANMNEIPDIPGNLDIPEYVLHQFAEDDLDVPDFHDLPE